MSFKKYGSPTKIKIVKKGGFSIDENALAERFLRDFPVRKITVDQVHNSLKSIGVVNYNSEDLSTLIGRLQAIGFKIER